MDTALVKRLMLARLLFREASEHARIDQELRSFAAVNLLHDAVEIFLITLAEKLNAAIDQRTPFDQYINKIDAEISPSKLPFRSQLMRLNRVRVSSKHNGIQPQFEDVRGFILAIDEFFRTVTEQYFDCEFYTVNLTSLIDSDFIRILLEESEREIVAGQYAKSLIASRKAFYILFEQHADLSDYAEGTISVFSAINAPSWAKSKSYIDRNVSDIFGMILLDIPKIDADLLKDGIDPVAFWNVWRLTPAVYKVDDETWLVKNELSKLNDDDAVDNAKYVLDCMVDIVLRKEARALRARGFRYGSRWTITVRGGDVWLYPKADQNREGAVLLRADVRLFLVDCSTVGVRDGQVYWHVVGSDEVPADFIYGYVHHEDVVPSAS